MKNNRTYILLRFAAIIILPFVAGCLYMHHHNGWFYFTIAIFLITVYSLFKLIKDVYTDFGNFVEALRYRDLSQRFSIIGAPAHLKIFRKGFNTIADEYKKLSFEKTTQYHYLQNVLEMVDTGIMAFENNSKNIVWSNALMKEYLQIPNLKNLNQLQKQNKEFYNEILSAKIRQQKVIQIKRDETEMKLLLTASVFMADEKQFKLIAIQNVNETLDITESEAWKKLLRVLTHEIMNSIAPISSVANTLQDRIEQVQSFKTLTGSDFHDFSEGIATIRSRSNGLLRFSESYRNLNKIESLNPSVFFIHDLFETMLSLMNPTLEQKNISLDIILKNPTLQINADRALIEQVLINLILNAIDAVKDKNEKEILLIGEKIDEQILIRVSDNGNGMDEETMDKIFIPFFTTKKTGSGIGLSLCKQIMLLHQGQIQVKSTIDEGTIFTLTF